MHNAAAEKYFDSPGSCIVHAVRGRKVEGGLVGHQPQHPYADVYRLYTAVSRETGPSNVRDSDDGHRSVTTCPVLRGRGFQNRKVSIMSTSTYHPPRLSLPRFALGVCLVGDNPTCSVPMLLGCEGLRSLPSYSPSTSSITILILITITITTKKGVYLRTLGQLLLIQGTLKKHLPALTENRSKNERGGGRRTTKILCCCTTTQNKHYCCLATNSPEELQEKVPHNEDTSKLRGHKQRNRQQLCTTQINRRFPSEIPQRTARQQNTDLLLFPSIPYRLPRFVSTLTHHTDVEVWRA